MSKDSKPIKVEITEKMILNYFIDKNMKKLASLDISTTTGMREMHKLSKKIAEDKKRLKEL